MKTRTGKIARLPAEIREQLNQRLADGARAIDVLPWLNALPAVQKILAEQFDGHPVRPQNISQWRKGGYADWATHRTGLAHWQNLLHHIDELGQERSLEFDNQITSRLSTLVVLELAESMNQLDAIEDPAERLRIFRLLSLSLSRLRRDDCREKRLSLADPFHPEGNQ